MRTRHREFLREDIGSGDITSELVVPADAMAKGTIAAKEDCVLAGVSDAAAVFEELGAEAVVLVEDGSHVKAGQKVLAVSGTARSLLAGERLALNLVMRMSGIANSGSASWP